MLKPGMEWQREILMKAPHAHYLAPLFLFLSSSKVTVTNAEVGRLPGPRSWEPGGIHSTDRPPPARASVAYFFAVNKVPSRIASRIAKLTNHFEARGTGGDLENPSRSSLTLALSLSSSGEERGKVIFSLPPSFSRVGHS